MKKDVIHFKRKHPIRKAVHRFWIKWKLFWTAERRNDFGVFIVSLMLMGLLFYMIIMYE